MFYNAFERIYFIEHRRPKFGRGCFYCDFAVELNVVFIFVVMVQSRFLMKCKCFRSFVRSHVGSQPLTGGLDGGVPVAILTDKRQDVVKK